jgi:cytochrome c biogenesis protein CcmG, thiol:disulfide interchange protein DsbE
MAEPVSGGGGRGSEAPGLMRVFLAAAPLIVFLALAGLFLKQMASGSDSRDIPSVLIGKPAPELTLPPLRGLANGDGPAPGLSSALLRGKVSIVNVWASWCAPCRAEHPLLMELAKDDRIQILGLNYKDQPANALRFLGQLGNPFAAIGVDNRGAAAIDWGVYGVPETFVVDANGIVRHKHVGPLTPESFERSFGPALERIVAAE